MRFPFQRNEIITTAPISTPKHTPSRFYNMSMKTQLYRQYRTVIDLWPIDPLRPQLSFQTFLRNRGMKEYGFAIDGDATIPAQDNSITPTAENASVGVGKPVVEFNEVKAMSELNALQTLLEDRYRKKYPVSEKILRPKGNPDYYDKLLREFEEAPERTWLQRKLNSWKGWIRIK